jgi:hypothetical protein
MASKATEKPPEGDDWAPAVRDKVSLVIGMCGGTGSGKSRSALEMARGLCLGDDEGIFAVDTESGRLKHYAPTPGQKPGPGTYGFRYTQLRAPFTPAAYMEKIDAAEKRGAKVILLDSFSHVWAGEGGVRDMHDEIVEQAVESSRVFFAGKGWKFDPDQARERENFAAWNKPKLAHKRLVSRMLQCEAHIIVCMRAEEKMRLETTKDEHGKKKTTFVQLIDMTEAQRWVPVCDKRFPFECSLSLLFTAARPGVPIPLRLEEQHRRFVPLDQPIRQDVGVALAKWGMGEDAAAIPAAQTVPIAKRVERAVAIIGKVTTRDDLDKAWAKCGGLRDELYATNQDELTAELSRAYDAADATVGDGAPDTSDGAPT